MGEDDPGGDLSGCLPPCVLNKPDVGHEHEEEHDGVQREDGGDRLPVREQRPALCFHTVLRGLVVNHPDDHQQEAGSDLGQGVIHQQVKQRRASPHNTRRAPPGTRRLGS